MVCANLTCPVKTTGPKPRLALGSPCRIGHSGARYAADMTVLLYTDDRFLEHDTGPYHPERPARLGAALEGLSHHGLDEALELRSPRPATDAELELVHPPSYIAALEQFCAKGGGDLDPDTPVSTRSAEIARLAAGAGLDAIEQLSAGGADSAFLMVRPPGHHATATRAMGFCLYNSAAIAGAVLADRGERVAIVDFDAHHGNGTNDIFYNRDDVLYVSWHQDHLYPGSGAVDQWGSGAGVGWTLNLPMPPTATGEHYRRSVEELVAPLMARHGSTWLIISAGFDAHRDDPLTDLGLTSGDFADITADLIQLVEPGRILVYLEGGYDLTAVAESTAATVGSLVGEHLHPEKPSAGGPGSEAISSAELLRRQLA